MQGSGKRKQGTGSREQELGFIILNDVKNLNLSNKKLTDFAGTDITYYGFSRDGVAAVPYIKFGRA